MSHIYVYLISRCDSWVLADVAQPFWFTMTLLIILVFRYRKEEADYSEKLWKKPLHKSYSSQHQ